MIQEWIMQTCEQLLLLARACLEQTRVSKSLDVANEFRQMARDYRQRAAELNDGKLPDIGEAYLP
jgi:hypothetical protein